MIEHIEYDRKLIATIVRAEFVSQKTALVTANEFNLQVGLIVYPPGGEVTRRL